GAFDCFKEYTRAQYFYQAPGDAVALDKIIKFGNVYQAQSANTSNTLFGDLQMPDIVPPKILPCAPWQLVQQLDYEKDVTGMYMSGHPLDNFKFEMKYYNITPLADYNEFKAAINTFPNPARSFRVAGLVVDGQHRTTKTGKPFGVLTIEDYTGKSEFMLWSEDYVKYNNYLEKGMIVLVEGGFKTRYNSDQYEFRLSKIHLLDTVKTMLTKQVTVDVPPQSVDEQFVNFVEANLKANPGSTQFKVNISDARNNYKVGMYTLGKGFTMNDEMAVFLNENPDVEVSVVAG
ncbi:MAG: OB-fold nucleic acid binding domain-containing protein, partial [Bacteroidota bacterium]